MGGRGSKSASASGRGDSAIAPTGATPENYSAFVDKYAEDRMLDVPLDKARDFMERGLNGLTPLQLYMDEIDGYGKATLMDDRDFDEYVRENELYVIYRGMPDSGRTSGVEKNMNFLTADSYYVGQGVMGDGMYFGDRQIAHAYATREDNQNGSVIRAALKKGAKIAEYDDIFAEYQQSKEVRDRKLLKSRYRTAELSAYAMSRGYDAIRHVSPMSPDRNSGFYVILNRSAIVASSELIDEKRR